MCVKSFRMREEGLYYSFDKTELSFSKLTGTIYTGEVTVICGSYLFDPHIRCHNLILQILKIYHSICCCCILYDTIF